MKNRLLFAVILTVAMAVSAHAGVDIRVGIPVPLPPTVVIQTAPEFIYSPALGFHVSVGAPYDIVYIGNDYYLYNNGYYYRSNSYNGPWIGVENRLLPPLLRKHRYEDIRSFRDKEFRKYERDREHYRGKWHRPGEMHKGSGHGGEGHDGEHRGGEGRH
jgi:hypothetical protein